LTVTTADRATSFRASVNKVAVVEGFYWGTTPEGIPHHEMEGLLTAIEAAATPAFRLVTPAINGSWYLWWGHVRWGG